MLLPMPMPHQPKKPVKEPAVIKNSTEPRVEVPLDDTNLFDAPDEENHSPKSMKKHRKRR